MAGRLSGTLGERVLGVLALGLLATTVGCGQGDYEATMKSRIKDIAFESNFIEGLAEDPTEIISEVAELRLPAFIDDDAKTLTRTSKNKIGEPIDVRRIQPPGVQIPGFRYSYEKFEDMGGRNNTQPLYVYFGSRPGSEPINKITGAIQRGARKISRNAAWQSVDLATPDRGQLSFQKLSVPGVQDFEVDPRGGQIQKKEGQLDIYVHSTKEHHVIIGFRATTEAAEKVEMFDVAPFSLGTLTVMSSDEEDDS